MENTHNYSFLEQEWPDYAHLGYIIESKLMMEPDQAVLKMKVLSELLIHDILEKNNMHSSVSSTTEERLHSIQTVGDIPANVVQKLRALRETDHTSSRDKQSLHSLNKQLVEVLHWFAKRYGAIDYASLSYNEPSDEIVEKSSNKLALYEVNYADLEEEIANESNIEVSRFTRADRGKENHLSEETTSSMVQNTKKPKSKFKRTVAKFLITAAVVLIAFLGINAYTVAQNHEVFPNSLDRSLVENVNGILGFSYGESAMNKAMEQKNSERIESLLAQGVDKNKLYPNGETLATYAVKEGDNKLLLSLLEDNADMSKHNADGETALEIAFKTDNERALGLLGAEKAPLSVSFVQNNLIGYWKSNEDEVIELKEESDGVIAIVHNSDTRLSIDLSSLSLLSKDSLKFDNREFSRGTQQDYQKVVSSQNNNNIEGEEPEVLIEETVTESDEEDNSQENLEAELANREAAEKEQLKTNVKFLDGLVGYWKATTQPKNEHYNYVIVYPAKVDESWVLQPLVVDSGQDYNYGAYVTNSLKRELDRANVLVVKDKLEYMSEVGVDPYDSRGFEEKLVIQNTSKDLMSLNFLSEIDSFGDSKFETIQYKKMKLDEVSTEFLEDFPEAFDNNQ